MDDMRIVELYRLRDEQAIVETDCKYGAYCRRISENILTAREDADECVNDTYHAVWTHIPPDAPVSLRAYIGRIIRNLSLSRYRANRAAKRYGGIELLLSELNDCVPAPDCPEKALEGAELTEQLNAWLHSLTADNRALFLRRYWYGDSVKALASAYGCTANQMTQRMLALRKNLRGYLERKGVSI